MGPCSSLALSGSVIDSDTGAARYGTKAVNKGSFNGPAVNLG